MDGLIVLNKPAGITSAKALYRLRAACGQKKSGHSGTLDRLADGVLVICLGRATKLVESIMDLRKRYRATARLDVTSRSLDSDTPLEPVAVRGFPSAEAVWSALAAFQGETLQRPPAVSALKIGGTPSYRLVARGREVELKPRRVRIYSVTPIAYEWPIVSFEVLCGRGTYIRSLVRDLGGRFDAGGCLTSLTRSAIGPFTLDSALSLSDVSAESVAGALIPLDEARERIAAG